MVRDSEDIRPKFPATIFYSEPEGALGRAADDLLKDYGIELVRHFQKLRMYTFNMYGGTTFRPFGGTLAPRNEQPPYVEYREKRYQFPFEDLITVLVAESSLDDISYWLRNLSPDWRRVVGPSDEEVNAYQYPPALIKAIPAKWWSILLNEVDSNHASKIAEILRPNLSKG